MLPSQPAVDDPVHKLAGQVEQSLLRALEDKELEIDEELKRLEQQDDDEMEKIRATRRRELQEAALTRNRLLQNGHGTYVEVDQSEFFQAAKLSEFLVVHFYRPATRRCLILDKHYSLLARKFVGTRFLKVNAEKSPFLADHLNIRILPTTLVCKNGKVDQRILGFEAFGGHDDFETSIVETFLKSIGVLHY